MEKHGNKTIMSGVLFLDIVEYSRKSVAGQISLKDRFNSYLSAAIRDVPVSDRIILDTGDGAAINFLGDIEDALKAALSLRESILSEDSVIDPPLQVRVGINLGPVRLVRDINGQPNIVGDGINVAQRVMGFADINQILVSRSYYDAVSRLSPQYAGMFHFQGSRTDKHVREHEVYAVGHIGENSTELAAANMLAKEEAKTPGHILAPVKVAWNNAASKLDGVIESIVVRFKQADASRRALYIGAIAIPVVLGGVLLLKQSHSDKTLPDVGQVQNESGIQPTPVDAPAPHATPRAESKAAVTSAAHPATTAKPDAKKTVATKADSKGKDEQVKHPATQSKTIEQSRDMEQTKAEEPVRTVEPVRTAEPAKAAEPARTVERTKAVEHKSTAKSAPATDGSAVKSTGASIFIICKEGTQLFVDGMEKGKVELFEKDDEKKKITIAKGLTVPVSPGKHKIIVTNKSGALYTQDVELNPGKTINIKPGFCD